ncbi:hypothetical protein OG21DRAFT_1484144 [Imleria badia]|nr:hypothetical protein OG21DRAFT_1484144 [Imleria badia]
MPPRKTSDVDHPPTTELDAPKPSEGLPTEEQSRPVAETRPDEPEQEVEEDKPALGADTAAPPSSHAPIEPADDSDTDSEAFPGFLRKKSPEPVSGPCPCRCDVAGLMCAAVNLSRVIENNHSPASWDGTRPMRMRSKNNTMASTSSAVILILEEVEYIEGDSEDQRRYLKRRRDELGDRFAYKFDDVDEELEETSDDADEEEVAENDDSDVPSTFYNNPNFRLTVPSQISTLGSTFFELRSPYKQFLKIGL